jgi:hypothetical protein
MKSTTLGVITSAALLSGLFGLSANARAASNSTVISLATGSASYEPSEAGLLFDASGALVSTPDGAGALALSGPELSAATFTLSGIELSSGSLQSSGILTGVESVEHSATASVDTGSASATTALVQPPTGIPEPASLASLGIGGLALMALRRKPWLKTESGAA